MGDKTKTTEPEKSIDELRKEATLLHQGIANLDVEVEKLTTVRTAEKKKLRALMGKIETRAMQELNAAA